MEPVFNLYVAVRDAVKSAETLALYRQDNHGSKYLASRYPHILAMADDLTLGWTLVPKTIIRNAAILKQSIDTYRTNLQCKLYPKLPEGVTIDQYLNMMVKALDFFEAQVLPLMVEMPEPSKPEVDMDDTLKVVKQLGLADPLTENYIDEDEESAVTDA